MISGLLLQQQGTHGAVFTALLLSVVLLLVQMI